MFILDCNGIFYFLHFEMSTYIQNTERYEQTVISYNE